jgi:DNA gyrase subunit A
MGRATQGVTLISVDDGSRLSGVRRVVESDADLDPEASTEESEPPAGVADGDESAEPTEE